MNNAFFRLVALGTCLLFSTVQAPAQYAGTNGIFAEFNTSLGSYTCVLYYAQSPKAVANFIGLATGQRAWLSLPSGVVKTNRFYTGTTFHRVIAGFMNQGGSPNGLGTDGPGYSFVDEFTNTLRFDKFGVLAMANSGPDSNGSQYFVTVSPQPSLNDVHTIFGRLYGGSNVVYAINHVVTGANDKPLTNVVVNSIIITNVGAAAAAFNLATQGLPSVTNLSLKIARASPGVSLTFSNRVNVDNRLYSSSNLMNWSALAPRLEVVVPATNTLFRTASLPSEFFRLAQIQYPQTLLVPTNVLNKTITVNFSAGNGTFVTSLNGSGGGSYTWSLGFSGAVLYNWVQDPYRGRFLPIILQNCPYILDLHLDFDSSTNGTVKGTAYLNYPSQVNSVPISGTFTNSP